MQMSPPSQSPVWWHYGLRNSCKICVNILMISRGAIAAPAQVIQTSPVGTNEIKVGNQFDRFPKTQRTRPVPKPGPTLGFYERRTGAI